MKSNVISEDMLRVRKLRLQREYDVLNETPFMLMTDAIRLEMRRLNEMAQIEEALR